MKRAKIETLVLKAQEEKLAGYRKDLMNAKSEAEASAIFSKINKTSRFISHVKQNGFCKEA